MKKINIGIIGVNWMGTCHLTALMNIVRTYGDEIRPVFKVVSDLDENKTREAVKKFGFERWTSDWREVIDDQEVDAVIITTPNVTHCEMVVAAAEAGKHILCEKPMAMTLEEDRKMVDAVEKASVKSLVGFVYCSCPSQVLAKDLVQKGKLGDIITLRAQFDTGAWADPQLPAAWRLSAENAGTGALGDMTSHLISLSDMITGLRICEVCAVADIVYPIRKDPQNSDETFVVDTDDQVHLIFKYENGVTGMMSSSRVSTGIGFGLGYEIHGSKGALRYDGSRLSELQFYDMDAEPESRGFTLIKGNMIHGDYSKLGFCNDTDISIADVLIIQDYTFLKAIAEDENLERDIYYGYQVDRVLQAAVKSSREKRWVKLTECV